MTIKTKTTKSLAAAMATLALAATSANAAISLVNEWNFDDGTANDSVGTNNLTIEGAGAGADPVFTSGYAAFAGSGKYLEVTNDLGYGSGDSWSIAMMVRDTNVLNNANSSGIVSGQNGGDSNSWQLSIRNPVATGNIGFEDDEGSLLDGEWHHVAFTHDSVGNNALNVYFDGIPVNTTTASRDHLENFTLGANRGTSLFFSGDLDTVQVYDSFLTSSEVLALAVPEPSTTALLGLGGLALILRRRK